MIRLPSSTTNATTTDVSSYYQPPTINEGAVLTSTSSWMMMPCSSNIGKNEDNNTIEESDEEDEATHFERLVARKKEDPLLEEVHEQLPTSLTYTDGYRYFRKHLVKQKNNDWVGYYECVSYRQCNCTAGWNIRYHHAEGILSAKAKKSGHVTQHFCTMADRETKQPILDVMDVMKTRLDHLALINSKLSAPEIARQVQEEFEAKYSGKLIFKLQEYYYIVMWCIQYL